MDKKIKKIVIAGIIFVIAGEILWILIIGGITIYAMDQADIIDMDELFDDIGSKNDSKTTGGNSPTVNGMLKACQEIADFYAANGYTYNKDYPPWDTHYRDGQYKTSCCSIYVLQVLIDCGLTDTLGDLDVTYVWNFLENDPNWERIDAKDESELKPRRYSNIQKWRISYKYLCWGWSILGCGRWKCHKRSICWRNDAPSYEYVYMFFQT